MSQNKHLKQIQSRLKRQKISVTYDNIRAVLLENFPDVDVSDMSEEEVCTVSQYVLNKYQSVEITIQDTALQNQHQDEIISDADLGTLAPKVQSELSHNQPSQIEQLAPQSAISIIQEIASDDSSKNKQLAQKLLEQADMKTTAIVSLVAAMPQIEAEMLKRKLEKMQRKQVDYEEVLGDYFRQSQDLTSHLKGLVREYGISF